MPWWKVGNKFVDSLDDDYEDMNEAISAFSFVVVINNCCGDFHTFKLLHLLLPGAPVVNPCGAELCG